MFAEYVDGLRDYAELRMDECSRVTVRRTSSTPAQDENTGRQTRLTQDVSTNIPFRLDGSSSSDGGTRRVEVNGVEYQQATAVGHLPASFTDLRDNDLLVITAGDWAGSTWRVIEASKGDQKTARRVPIVEA